MTRFYEPDLTSNPDDPFVRDASNKLVRRGYWIDMPDKTLVMVMAQGIGANLSNDEKRAHLIDLKRGHLIERVCVTQSDDTVFNGVNAQPIPKATKTTPSL